MNQQFPNVIHSRATHAPGDMKNVYNSIFYSNKNLDNSIACHQESGQTVPWPRDGLQHRGEGKWVWLHSLERTSPRNIEPSDKAHREEFIHCYHCRCSKQPKLNNVDYVYVYREIISAKFMEQEANKSMEGISVILVIANVDWYSHYGKQSSGSSES